MRVTLPELFNLVTFNQGESYFRRLLFLVVCVLISYDDNVWTVRVNSDRLTDRLAYWLIWWLTMSIDRKMGRKEDSHFYLPVHHEVAASVVLR